jgi:hypothetical protein
MANKRIRIFNHEMKKIKDFAEARAEGSKLYEKRGGFKIEDIIVGAMAELAVYKMLKDAGFKINKPDFTVYDKSKKSYDGDLSDGTRHFHVKGQSRESAKRYGDSWLMQKYDPLIRNPDKVRNNYLVPCSVSMKKNEVVIKGIYTFSTLHRLGLFMDCKVPWFNKTKCAIYGEFLPKGSFRILEKA